MVYNVHKYTYLCVVYCKYIVLYFINHSKTVETIIVALGTAIDALRPLTVYKYTSVLKNDVTKKLLLLLLPRTATILQSRWGGGSRGRARENVCYEVRPGEPAAAATCAAAAATMD